MFHFVFGVTYTFPPRGNVCVPSLSLHSSECPVLSVLSRVPCGEAGLHSIEGSGGLVALVLGPSPPDWLLWGVWRWLLPFTLASSGQAPLAACETARVLLATKLAGAELIRLSDLICNEEGRGHRSALREPSRPCGDRPHTLRTAPHHHYIVQAQNGFCVSPVFLPANISCCGPFMVHLYIFRGNFIKIPQLFHLPFEK